MTCVFMGVWWSLNVSTTMPKFPEYHQITRYISWSKLLLYCSHMVLTQIDWCLYIHYILIYPLYSDTGHTSWTVHPSPAPLRVSPFGVRREAKTWGPTWQRQRSDGPRPTSVNKQSLVMLVLICCMPLHVHLYVYVVCCRCTIHTEHTKFVSYYCQTKVLVVYKIMYRTHSIA